jgi:hypothetical protein
LSTENAQNAIEDALTNGLGLLASRQSEAHLSQGRNVHGERIDRAEPAGLNPIVQAARIERIA